MARATQAEFHWHTSSPIFKYRVIQRVIHQGLSQGDQGVIHGQMAGKWH